MSNTVRGNTAGKGLLAGGVKGALAVGVVVGGVDDVDGDIVVWVTC